jgi:hypothetical protein
LGTTILSKLNLTMVRKRVIGRGGQVKTVYEDLKYPNCLDEAIVPCNIHDGARYLRDVGVAELLEEMVQKQLIVTVVLDVAILEVLCGALDVGDLFLGVSVSRPF